LNVICVNTKCASFENKIIMEKIKNAKIKIFYKNGQRKNLAFKKENVQNAKH